MSLRPPLSRRAVLGAVWARAASARAGLCWQMPVAEQVGLQALGALARRKLATDPMQNVANWR